VHPKYSNIETLVWNIVVSLSQSFRHGFAIILRYTFGKLVVALTKRAFIHSYMERNGSVSSYVTVTNNRVWYNKFTVPSRKLNCSTQSDCMYNLGKHVYKMFTEEKGTFPDASTPWIFTGTGLIERYVLKKKHGIACSVSSISARDENNVIEYENST